ncbi:MAG: MFS transporter [Myxococcales bacterium]|nr:MFS transporter [Myxococcales bacterium]
MSATTLKSDRFRLSLWFSLAIGSLGALHPFLSLTLAKRGLDPDSVAGILALFPAGFLVAGPLWGWLGDATSRPEHWMRGAALGAAVFGGMLLTEPSLPMLVAALAGIALFRAPLFPLVDALTVARLGDDRGQYGRVRLWGSVAFGGAVFLVGSLIDQWAIAPLGVTAALLAGLVLVTWRLPQAPIQAKLATLSDLRTLSGRGPLGRLLFIAICHGIAHATYDFLFALHMDALGAPTWQTTAAFVGGLTLEVAIMAWAPRLLTRLGPVGLIKLAAWMAVPRFLVTALPLPTALIAAVQVLHGISFGAFWLGAVAYVAVAAPPRLRNTAQAALMAASAGVGPLLLLLGASVTLQFVSVTQLFIAAAVLAALAASVAGRLTATHDAKEDTKMVSQ